LSGKSLHPSYLLLAHNPQQPQVHHIAKMLGHNRKEVALAGTNTHEIGMRQKMQQDHLDRSTQGMEKKMATQLLPRMAGP